MHVDSFSRSDYFSESNKVYFPSLIRLTGLGAISRLRENEFLEILTRFFWTEIRHWRR